MNEPSRDREQTEHEAMGRVRTLLERDRIGADAARRRPWWPRVVGLVLALAVVGIFVLGLDAFLAAYQRLLDTPAPAAPAASGKSGETPESGAIPVFVVPEEPEQDDAPTQGGAPMPGEAPAPETPSGTTAPDDDPAPR